MQGCGNRKTRPEASSRKTADVARPWPSSMTSTALLLWWISGQCYSTRKEKGEHPEHTVMQRVDDCLYLRLLILVLLGGRTLRKWVMLEKKSLESPLEERKGSREETFMRRVEAYLCK